MNNYNKTRAISSSRTIAVNSVLRNTFILLGFSLLTTAASTYFSIALRLPMIQPLLFLMGIMAFSFAINAYKESYVGLVLMLLYSAFLGYVLSHTVLFLLQTPFGYKVLLDSLAGTSVIFFALASYVLITKENFSYMKGMIIVLAIIPISLVVISLFTQSAILQLAISGFFILFSSSVILYQISELVHGGERNYIVAALSIYVSIYNIFLSLINILSLGRND